jgi:exodeoxyribonuclease V alpha subunit
MTAGAPAGRGRLADVAGALVGSCLIRNANIAAVPIVRLTEVFRQAAESRIIVNAHRINQGLMPELAPLESGDFYFVDAAEAEEGVRKLLTIVQERIPKRFELKPMHDIQVLCPMNNPPAASASARS